MSKCCRCLKEIDYEEFNAADCYCRPCGEAATAGELGLKLLPEGWAPRPQAGAGEE